MISFFVQINWDFSICMSIVLFTHSTANPSNKFLYSWELIDRKGRKTCFKTYAKLFQNLEYLFKQDSCEDRIMYWSCFESWWYFLLYQNLSSCPIEMNQHSSVFVLNLITMVLSSYFLYIYRICFHSCQKISIRLCHQRNFNLQNLRWENEFAWLFVQDASSCPANAASELLLQIRQL